MTINVIQAPVAQRTIAPGALDAATLCETFRITVATHPQRAALRTPGDEVVVTWEQYAALSGVHAIHDVIAVFRAGNRVR